jgi:hypothetical protein
MASQFKSLVPHVVVRPGYPRYSRVRCLLLYFSVGMTGMVQAQIARQNGTQQNKQIVQPLSAEATQVAQQIGVDKLLQSSSNDRSLDASGMVRLLLLRQQITGRVLSASLDIDSVNALIDYEVEQNKTIRSDLETKRDKAQNFINIASFVTSGALGVTSTALQFKSSTANVGNAIGIAGGATSVTLSIVGLHKQAGGRQALSVSPRMLAAFFGRTPDPQDQIAAVYPEPVWKYLNSPAPLHSATRKDELIEKWKHDGYLDAGSTAGSQSVKSEAVLGEVSHLRMLTIDEMSGREKMLLEIRATLSLMKRDLGEILMDLSSTEPIDAPHSPIEAPSPQ